MEPLSTRSTPSAGFACVVYASELRKGPLLNDTAACSPVRDRGYDSSPLHKAAAQGHAAFVRLLLKYGADVNIINEAGETPLHITCLLDQPEVRHIALCSFRS
jgi:hypothetical protein